MSNKYIIRNCPALRFPLKENPICDELPPFNNECKDCTDCILKQIVELCTKAIEIYANNNFYDDDRDRFMGESFMAEKILDLLDIQEVE